LERFGYFRSNKSGSATAIEEIGKLIAVGSQSKINNNRLAVDGWEGKMLAKHDILWF
jgi:hypothetical protein